MTDKTTNQLSGDAKLIIGFLADILYQKEILCYDEFIAIDELRTPVDLQEFLEKMLRGEFNVYKRGETYGNYKR